MCTAALGLSSRKLRVLPCEGNSSYCRVYICNSRILTISTAVVHPLLLNPPPPSPSLCNRGVPVDVRDNFGNTALIVACQNGHKRALKAVLRRGADPNAINARGNTALHYCYAFGYGGTLGRYLMEKGADSSIRNRSGMVSLSLKGIASCIHPAVPKFHHPLILISPLEEILRQYLWKNE